MRIAYSRGTETVETVYTYEEWLKEYNRREVKRKIKQRTERLYYMKQRLLGIAFMIAGITSPFLLDGEATFSIIALPFGIFLLLTKEKILMF